MPLWPFRPKLPIDAASQAWVNARMEWLADQFGMQTWLEAEAIEPNDKFFPDRFDGSEHAAGKMLDRICGLMGVEPGRVALRLYAEDRNSPLAKQLRLEMDTKGSAGHYRVDGKEIVGIESAMLKDPLGLVATIAHELGHVRLLGEGRISREEEDHERLTDLTTVFFGLGIFNANCAFRFSQWTGGTMHGWKASTQGYLDEQTFGYALGLWTTVRGEQKPDWTKHLNVNPRAYMKQSLRYLKANPPEAFR